MMSPALVLLIRALRILFSANPDPSASLLAAEADQTAAVIRRITERMHG